MRKKILLSSILTIAICLCLIIGSTFALFTNKTGVDISVEAGNVNIVATIQDSLQVKSLTDTDFRDSDTFTNGGTATLDSDGVLVIERMTPGDEVKFTVKVVNNSNVAVKYKINAVSQIAEASQEVKDLSEALVIETHVVAKNNASETEINYTMNYSDTADARSFETGWFGVDATNGNGAEIVEMTVIVKFPNGTPEHDNPFQKAKAKIAFTVDAVQYNGVDENGNLIQ